MLVTSGLGVVIGSVRTIRFKRKVVYRRFKRVPILRQFKRDVIARKFTREVIEDDS